MRILSSIAAALVLAALAPNALAHGGGGFRDPGHRRAPSIACDCAKPDCPACAAKRPMEGEWLTKRTLPLETTRSWGELAEVRAAADFTTTQQRGLVEALVRLEHAPILAVTGGAASGVESDVTGVLAPSSGARRDYLWQRDRLRDPMLVLREGPGALTMRVSPISPRGTTRATVTAFTLLAWPAPTAPRFYRTRDRFLVVLPRTPESERDADLVDEAGGRVLVFLSESACRARWGRLAERAYAVPCVPALDAAAHGKGDAAVTEETALIALPANSHAPADLFVGPAENAPVSASGVPPGLREPSDPPPPPPPPVETRTPSP